MLESSKQNVIDILCMLIIKYNLYKNYAFPILIINITFFLNCDL